MKYLFLLSGDYPGIAREEVLSLINAAKYGSIENLIIADIDENSAIKSARRLALTKRMCRLLFECSISDIEKSMKGFGWDSVTEKAFA